MVQFQFSLQLAVNFTHLLITKSHGRSYTPKIGRVYLGDVGGERCMEQVVWATSYRLTLRNRLLSMVVVKQSLSFRANGTQELLDCCIKRCFIQCCIAVNFLFQAITSCSKTYEQYGHKHCLLRTKFFLKRRQLIIGVIYHFPSQKVPFVFPNSALTLVLPLCVCYNLKD